jgi:hypothetical protein
MDLSLPSLLEQALERVASARLEPRVRLSMAHLAAHCLREIDTEPDERTIALVLATLGRSLDQYAVVVSLGRALWVTTLDDARLFSALSKLAAAAFQDGHTHSLAELVELLCLTGRSEQPLPEEWGRAAAAVRTRNGIDARAVRLVTRWTAVFDRVPPWLRAVICEQPEILAQLSDQVVRGIHRRWPVAPLWRALATRASDASVPEVQRHMREVARDELAMALRLETSTTAKGILAAWQRALG